MKNWHSIVVLLVPDEIVNDYKFLKDHVIHLPQSMNMNLVTTPTNIFLVGLMGVGKSTIGKKLARLLGTSYIDCDQEIERRTGASVNMIFDIEGEAGFRKREARLLAELATTRSGVIATGGGVVIEAANRHLLKNASRTIYLNAPVDLLWARLRYCKNRPLLQTQNPKARLNALYNERDPHYREVATDVVNVGKNSASSTANKIAQLISTSS